MRGGPARFLCGSPRTGQWFTIGSEERFLLYLLERTESSADISSIFAKRFHRGLTDRRIEEFINQLREYKLLVESDPKTGAAVPPEPELQAETTQPVGATLNFVFDILVLLFGWMLHPVWLLPLAALVIADIQLVHSYGSLMLRDFVSFGDRYTWSYYFVFVILPHHFAFTVLQSVLAGIACRRFGGRLKRFEFCMYLGFVPSMHIEYDESIVLMSRRGRNTFIFSPFWFMVANCSLGILGWAIASQGTELSILFLSLIPPSLLRVLITMTRVHGALTNPTRGLNAIEAMRSRVEPLQEKPLTFSEKTRSYLYWFFYHSYRLVLALVMGAAFSIWLIPKYDGWGVLSVVMILALLNYDLLVPRRTVQT